MPIPADAIVARVWRLAFLLSGDREAADRLARKVLTALPSHPDPARVDRMVVLRAREGGPRRFAGEASGAGEAALRVACSLPNQQREAWVLARIDRLGDIAISRAMDCSRSAMQRHLAQADDAIRAGVKGEPDGAIAALRMLADDLDPSAFAVEYVSGLKRARRVRIVSALVLVGLVLAGIAIAALKWTAQGP